MTSEPLNQYTEICRDAIKSSSAKVSKTFENLLLEIKCAETLKLSKRKTLDTRGKILIDYDYKIPIKQLWIYWGQFDVCIGLNGLMYEISERFARKLNQIMQKEANIVIFDSRWFEFLHKREVEGT